jgi:hypothetical protein
MNKLMKRNQYLLCLDVKILSLENSTEGTRVIAANKPKYACYLIL